MTQKRCGRWGWTSWCPSPTCLSSLTAPSTASYTVARLVSLRGRWWWRWIIDDGGDVDDGDVDDDDDNHDNHCDDENDDDDEPKTLFCCASTEVNNSFSNTFSYFLLEIIAMARNFIQCPQTTQIRMKGVSIHKTTY